ncbi:MAG: ABC transporter ATP-binding protein [Rhodomicrobium sp.]
MSDVVIRAEGLGKKYLIGHESQQERYTALRDVIGRTVKGFARSARDMMRGRQLIAGDEVEEFWALKDVSFEIKRGDVVGIIGRNGAGKSTLLKILSRITEPSTGRVEIKGRVASLLEVGTGFHPELTGRENIFLNGAILGMSHGEIKRKFDEIVAFAEVEKFLDTPVKRYSSGMYVRLAFAVAAHLEPEILVVDEVLAVGDAEFQKKCLGKMQDVAGHGRTVLFVSHNMAAIQALCSRGLVLQAGCLVFEGAKDEATTFYSLKGETANITSQWRRKARDQIKTIGFANISASLHGTQPHLQLRCEVLLECTNNCSASFIAVDILDGSRLPIMQALPHHTPFIEAQPGLHKIDIIIDLPPLIPGNYIADFWLGSHNTSTIDAVGDAVSFEITTSPTKGRTFPHTKNHGTIVPLSRCEHSFLS